MLLHNMLKSTSDILYCHFPSERNEIRNGIRTCGPT